MNIALQFDFNGLKLGPDLFKAMFQTGPHLLKVVFQGEFQRLKVWLGGEVFITAGLPPGDDFGLGFRHARAGQALDEGVSVEGDLRFREARNSGWDRGLQVGMTLFR